MCIVFVYVGSCDEDSDFSLIVAANRDEHFDRPAKNAALWAEDVNVIGGRDMESGCEGGTWLAMSPLRKRLGLLLNLPGNPKEKAAKSRGKIVEDFVKDNASVNTYIDSIKAYSKDANDFNFIITDFSNAENAVLSYNNVTEKLEHWPGCCVGFSNSLPDTPLKKVEAGKNRFQDLCCKLNKISMKAKLIDEIIQLLKWDKRHLPDQELVRRHPNMSEHLSSIFVSIPERRYGTRTHTIVLLTKNGQTDFIELTMQSPIDPEQPVWQKTEFQFQM